MVEEQSVKEKKRMSEEKVMIPLTKGKKNAVIIGCVCLMFSVTVFGVGFFVIQGPI